MTACQLIKENQHVTEVIAKNKKDEYHCFLAKKGVVLAAGDYSKNKEMCEDLLTEAADLISKETDWSGHGWDGSGIKMGVWAGGRLEPRSHAAMGGNYSFPGFDLIGSTAVLRVNKYGTRYSNEGYGTHILAATTGARQPNGMLWAVFDSRIYEQLEYQAPCHAVFDYTEPGKIDKLKQTLKQAGQAGMTGIMVGKEKPLYCADTLEVLAGYMFQDNRNRMKFLTEVQRYNKLCKIGYDVDYGKESNLLFSLENPPYYAYGQIKDSNHPGGQSLKLLVTVSGLMINENQEVLDDDFEPIPGLYATGNCSGGRFGTAYTTSVPGQSISVAQTLGMVLGKYIANA